jgi:uncharacterized repeat protein (TIGR03803 family)
MMKSEAQTPGVISGLRRRPASGPLLLAIQIVVTLLVVQSAQAQTYTVLYKFSGGSDGAYPAGGVIRDTQGKLYGTTSYGGSFGYGVVFKLDAAGKETVLHNFTGEDGMWPSAGLVRDAEGNLYGTTYDGGTAEGGKCIHGCGTVFKLDNTGKETVLYAFTGGVDGRNPGGGLVRNAAGNLYGTTRTGGDLSCRSYQPGCGVVFEVDKSGKETVLHAFTDADGDYPVSGLVRDGAGNLYGVTYDGGASDRGVVFKVAPGGKTTVLHSFLGTKDGGNPNGKLVRDAAGNLYGVAPVGGDSSCYPQENGCGVVFKLSQGGKETVLYSFTAMGIGFPEGGLVRDGAGTLYGTTDVGCILPCGTVFKLDTNGKETLLHSFAGSGGGTPSGGLIEDKAGNLYGTAAQGGKGMCSNNEGCGVVYKLTP